MFFNYRWGSKMLKQKMKLESVELVTPHRRLKLLTKWVTQYFFSSGVTLWNLTFIFLLDFNYLYNLIKKFDQAVSRDTAWTKVDPPLLNRQIIILLLHLLKNIICRNKFYFLFCLACGLLFVFWFLPEYVICTSFSVYFAMHAIFL